MVFSRYSPNAEVGVEVEATEGLAIIEFHAPVGHVQGIQRRGKAFAEVLSAGKIQNLLRRFVRRRWITITRSFPSAF